MVVGEEIPEDILNCLENELLDITEPEEINILFSIMAKEYKIKDMIGTIRGYDNWLVLTEDRSLLLDHQEVVMNADTSKCKAEYNKGILFYDSLIYKRPTSEIKIQFEKNKRDLIKEAVDIINVP